MADLEIQYDPITVNSGPIGVTLNGLDNVKVDGKLAVTQPIQTDSKLTVSIPDTIRTDSKTALTIPEPIRTDSKADINLEPVAIDQCLRLSLAPLPNTRICLPNRQRIGVSIFGVEIFGLTLEGEAQIIVAEPHRPNHLMGGPQRRWAEERGGDERHPSLRTRLEP